MSIFNGKFRRRGGLTGKITDQTPRLQITITPRNDAPRVTIVQSGGFRGAWARAGQFFGGAVKRISILYRFLAATVPVLLGFRAAPIAAPAVTAKADNAVTAATTAKAAARPDAAAKLDRAERLGVVARGAAYRRTVARYIRNILTGSKATPEAAPGAVGHYRKPLVLERKTKATQAPATIAESRFNKVQTGTTATSDAAAAVTGQSVLQSAAKIEATGTAAKVVSAAVKLQVPIAFTAKGGWWFLPETMGDQLHIFQVFSGIQSGECLEIDLEEASAYWAQPVTAGGVLELNFANSAAQENNSLEVV